MGFEQSGEVMEQECDKRNLEKEEEEMMEKNSENSSELGISKKKKGKLSMELIEKIRGLKGEGATDLSVASACDITKLTFSKWLKLGEAEWLELENSEENTGKNQEELLASASIYVDLFLACGRGEFEFKDSCTKKIQVADKQWQASAWLLERSFPLEYGKKSAVELTGKEGNALQVEQKCSLDFSDLTMEELEILEGLTEKVRGNHDADCDT